jgi:hypothetical protein
MWKFQDFSGPTSKTKVNGFFDIFIVSNSMINSQVSVHVQPVTTAVVISGNVVVWAVWLCVARGVGV